MAEMKKNERLELVKNSQTNAIQLMNVELGLAKSELLTQKNLTIKYEKEIEKFPGELRKLIRDHKLDLQAKDLTIAKLSTKLNGGSTIVIETPETPTDDRRISYSWHDPNQRFFLDDPDIFTKDNETFKAKQLLQLKGWVFSDDDGKVQIKKVEIFEVIEKGRTKEGGAIYDKIEGTNIEIVDSIFEYAEPATSTVGLWDVVRPKVYTSYDTSADLGLGVEVLNFGKLAPFANIGVGAEINPNLSSVLDGSLSQTRLGANLTYRFLEPLVDSNLGIGLGVSTPANDLGGRWELTGDLIFYLTN